MLHNKSVDLASNSLEQVKEQAKNAPAYFSFFLDSLLRGCNSNSLDHIYYGDLTKYPSGYKNWLNRHIWALFPIKTFSNTVYGTYGKDNSDALPF